ncbi:MAG: hypothetical protein PHQ60_02195 [Sideroxydans sp.]|nr:hypothetical protein [Sideroxydans sp.]MDD5056654.1 hypothetical protein [Sideroxydans sp.]
MMLASTHDFDEATPSPWDYAETGVIFEDREIGGSIHFENESDQPTVETPLIDASDYEEGPEREAFERIKKAVRAACNVNSADAQRIKALEWIFVPNAMDKNSLTFSLCCGALGARPYLIQVRLQYQLYLACLPLPAPLPFLAVSIPASLCSEILCFGGELSLDVAKEIWFKPGIRADMLRDMFSHVPNRELLVATELIEERGIIGLKMGHWFFTGRQPDALPIHVRSRFHWSDSII